MSFQDDWGITDCALEGRKWTVNDIPYATSIANGYIPQIKPLAQPKMQPKTERKPWHNYRDNEPGLWATAGQIKTLCSIADRRGMEWKEFVASCGLNPEWRLWKSDVEKILREVRT